MFAHSFQGRPEAEWEPLERHLTLVADGESEFPGAGGFAAAFGAGEWGRLLGLWHDLGKYSIEFQDRLRTANGFEAHLEDAPNRVDHATAGAQHAAAVFPGPVGRMLAYCIAGHHGGLPDGASEFGKSGLAERLTKRVHDWSAAPAELLDQSPPPIPRLCPKPTKASPDLQWAFFCRMVFSCLVDADYLATESFMRPETTALRVRSYPGSDKLLAALDEHLAQRFTDTNSALNRTRAGILAACRAKAELTPGLFSLTVPTGGGKTLSSLAFALTHAVKHHMRRVIYAIPFTSIIEQNVDVFRRALGDVGRDAIIEHHSNLDPEKETVWGRLAAENWDAPLVVTTNVQLFESLFACKPSRCRKLHRIARSVIVLDECQTLPVELLRPTLLALDELARNYGCTIVLCTATQPAIRERSEFPIGLNDVREIVDDPAALARSLERARIEHVGKLTDDELIARLAPLERVLCVVNTKPHAAALFSALRELRPVGTYHLSTNMCPRHRSGVLRLIRWRLRTGRPCRVISTQLIEAGVDVDFPVVYRAQAGLDSVTQAAGRCNREGKLALGHVYLFETDVKPPHSIAQAAATTSEVMQDHPNLLDLDAIEQFFRLHYWLKKSEWDKNEILSLFQMGNQPHFQFREAAERYQLIEDATRPVLVPYGGRGRRLLNELRRMSEPPDRHFARKLQRYTVAVREWHFNKLRENEVIAPFHEQYWVVMNEAAYSKRIGLGEEASGWSPESLIE